MAFWLSLLFAAAPPQTVTVLYFDNNSGDKTYDSLGKGIADMMITDLAKVPGLILVEREKLQTLLRELKLQRSKLFDPKTAQKIGKGIGAKLAVTGAFLALDPEIRIDVRVIEIASAKILKASIVTGKKDAFFKVEAALAKALVENLGYADAQLALANGAGTLAVVNDYGESLDDRDEGNLSRANQGLAEVLEAQPDFALAKQRQAEIMRELDAAKGRRRGALQAIERTLLETIDLPADQFLDPRVELSDVVYGHEAKTIVRGDVYLKRVADALERKEPGYRHDLFFYVDNTERHIETLDQRDHQGKNHTRFLGYPCPNDGAVCLDADEREAMAQLGLKVPIDDKQRGMIHQLALDVANLMMHGEAPARAGWKMPERVCFYELSKRFPNRAFALYDLAERSLTEYPDDMWEWWQKEIPNQGAVVALWRARSYDRIGKHELAVKALQDGMRAYPTAKSFSALEAAVRDLVKGKHIAQKCKPPK